MDGNGNRKEQKIDGMMNDGSCDMDVCKNADKTLKCTVSDSASKCSTDKSSTMESNKAKSDDVKNTKSYAKVTMGNGHVWFFVGYNMSLHELKYNGKRMWGNYGLKEVLNNGNGIFLFKFCKTEGMKFVVENGPWLVNNKPLMVQQWDINMCVAKTEPTKLPIWVKMCNVPHEAWTFKGISALASRIGKPIIMDVVTAQICQVGMVRTGYARVLVEVNAQKEFPAKIVVAYKNKDKEIIGIKMIHVIYN
ncbi:zinc knuckle CX2CX4HX4C containing protein [Tanacetum coccineum]